MKVSMLLCPHCSPGCLLWQAQHLQVPMRIREEGREERSAPVLVAVSIEADAQSSTPRSLMCFQVNTDDTNSARQYVYPKHRQS